MRPAMEKFLLHSYGGPHWAHPDPVGETLAALRPAELLRLHVCSHGSTTGGYTLTIGATSTPFATQ